MRITSIPGSNLSAAISAPTITGDAEQHITHIVQSAAASTSCTLDLATAEPHSLSCLSPATRDVIINNLAQQITHLILPSGLEVIPEWLKHFVHLTQLEIPNYLGKRIDLLDTAFPARHCVIHTNVHIYLKYMFIQAQLYAIVMPITRCIAITAWKKRFGYSNTHMVQHQYKPPARSDKCIWYPTLNRVPF